MKKIIYALMALLFMTTSHIYANTQVPATNVTSTIPSNPKCLSSSNTNVQSALNALDQCSGQGSAGNPAGVNTQYQINNNGVFGGGNMYNVSGNVGINSTTPRSQLDVNGAVTLQGFSLPVGTGLTGKVLTSDANGNGTWQVSIGGTGTVNPGTQGDFPYYASTGPAVSDQNVLTIKNGNIGIGSSSATANLEVFGSGAISPSVLGAPTLVKLSVPTGMIGYAVKVNGTNNTFLWLEDNSTWIGHITSAQSPNSLSFTSANGYALNIGSGGTAITAVSSGNVGIGSITPGQKLDVQGTVRSLGASIGSLTGILKGTSGNVGTATSGTDFAPATSGTSILKGNGSGGFSPAVAGTDYEGPLVFSTGLTNTTGTVVVNNSQSIVQLSNLTSNGVITTNGSNGTLSITPLSRVQNLWETNSVGIDTFYPVGIGSVNPGQALDVNGTVRATNFVGNGSGLTNIPAEGAAGVSGQLQFNSSGAMAGANVYQDSNGNVGIGQNAPTQPFVVNGNAQAGELIATGAGNTYFLNNVGIGTTTGIASPLYVNGGITGNVINMIGSGSSSIGGPLGVNTISPAYTLDVNGTIHAANFVGGLPWTNAGSNTYLTSSSNNVGIGTISPDRTLDVVNYDSNSTLTTASLASMGIKNLYNAGNNNFADVAFSTTDTNGAIQLGSKVSGIFTSHTPGAVSGGLVFLNKTSGTTSEAMRILGGNVGVGSTAPGQKLDVQGTVRATNFVGNGSGLTGISVISGLTTNFVPRASSSTNIQNGVMFDNGTNVGVGTSTALNAALTVNGAINVLGSGTSPFTITGVNVGIGSATPGQLLDVQGTVRMLDFNIAASAGSGKVLTSDGSGNGTWSSAGSGSNYWSLNGGTGNVGISTTSTVGIGTTSGSASLTVFGGNVGIGTYNPAWPLEVEGNVSIGTPVAVADKLYVNGNTFVNGSILTGTSDNIATGIAGNISVNNGGTTLSSGTLNVATAATGLLLQTQGNTRIDILSGGNVGIGTTIPSGALTVMNGNVGIGTWVPGYMLEVNGTVRGSAFQGKGSSGIGWSVKTGSNTACNTTCPSNSPCVFGFDTGLGGSDVVACTDATADTCVCAGP